MVAELPQRALLINNLIGFSGETGDPSLHSWMDERMPVLVQTRGTVHVELVFSLDNIKKQWLKPFNLLDSVILKVLSNRNDSMILFL